MMREESASCIALRSPLSWRARKMRPYHPSLGTNPPRVAPVQRGASSSNPRSLKRLKERLKKNPPKTTSGSPSNVARPGAGLRQRLQQGPQAPKPSARGRKERFSCASSRSKLTRQNKGKHWPRKRKAGSEVPRSLARSFCPWQQRSVMKLPLQVHHRTRTRTLTLSNSPARVRRQPGSN